MAGARSLRDQVLDLPSKDALIKVLGCAKGFDPVAPDDVLFTPEMGRVEDNLFPNDTRSARSAVAPSERLTLVGRAIHQLGRYGHMNLVHFAYFDAAVQAVREGALTRLEATRAHFSMIDPGLQPEEVIVDAPAAQAGTVGPGAGGVTRGEVDQMLTAQRQEMRTALAGQKREFDQIATDLKTDLNASKVTSVNGIAIQDKGH